ncbi:chemotaxis protein CheW [Sphingomonas sp.]|uniref:chemotaxis protein CheW n=1 Tax=Sphingomonas sp. TaxID=28214 RepID=UPI0025FCE4E5|nr:chemotaxis protein CheW [Sphingomonas sp.]
MADQLAGLYVIATVSGQRIAFDAATVASVVDLGTIVPVPMTPESVLGLSPLRSNILTVIDLGGALGQPLEHHSRRAVTMAIDDHHYAFVVASVEQVEPIIEGVQPVDASVGSDWVSAASGRIQTESGMALLMDPRRLVGLPAEMMQ